MKKEIKNLRFGIWYKLKVALSLFLLSFVSVYGVLALLYYNDLQERKTIIELRASNTVNMQSAKLGNNFQLLTADLLFFSKYNQLLGALENSGVNIKHLAEDFALFSEGSKIYDQIRIIDSKGYETVRINFINGKAVTISAEELQFKGTRYYFKDAYGLKRGEIFISPFDLNVEQGKIEQPLKPMIRFATPIFDRKDQKRGIIIFNYLGAHLIQNMKDVAMNSPGFHMLLNSDGYWFVGRDVEDEWGFMYKDKKDRTMRNVYPDAWEKISTSESGQFYNAQGLVTFATVYPLSEGWKSSSGAGEPFAPSKKIKKAREQYWKVVSLIPQSLLQEKRNRLLGKYIATFVCAVILFAFGSWFLASALARRKFAERQLKESHENLERKVEERTFEIGEVNKALQKMLSKEKTLLRELHHRVKNNMVFLQGLIALQQTGVRDDRRLFNILEAVKQRIQSIGMVHQLLYQSKDLSEIDFSVYIMNVIDVITQTFNVDGKKIDVSLDLDPVKVDIETAVPCGLIVSELLVNIFKHAFPDRESGRITVSLKEKDGVKELKVMDDGDGMEDELVFGKGETMGMKLISQLTKQIEGKITYEKKEGSRFTIRF